MRPIPACPECGGTNTRKFFKAAHGYSSLFVSFKHGAFTSQGVYLASLICVECGYTELRPHPDDLPAIRKAAEQL